MYGEPSEESALEWSWVDAQLQAAGTYWVVGRSDGSPHPRPVWGVWSAGLLHLSIGSPPLLRQLNSDSAVAVHLDSGTDVVIVEGLVRGMAADPDAVASYDAKYEWNYNVDEYGAFAVIQAQRVLAWRAAGFAGREGFKQTGRWRY